MYKVILVDDEPLALSGLAEIIDWEIEGFRISGLCGDAESALLLYEKTNAEIIFTDLKMPGTNGIELIAKLRERSSEIKCVIISAYSDFDVARKALAYNASGYILKPLQSRDIIELLRRLREELDRSIMEQFLIDLEDEDSIHNAGLLLELKSTAQFCRIVISSNDLPCSYDARFFRLQVRNMKKDIWFCSTDEKRTIPKDFIGSRWHTGPGELSFMIREAAAAGNGCFLYAEHEFVSKIQFYIGMHYDKVISLKNLAGEFNVSESYLCELFKKHTGYTVIAFYTMIRLHNARRLLLHSSMSIKEIAQAAGFNDYSYFYRSFRQIFSLGPDHLRKIGAGSQKDEYPFPLINWPCLNQSIR
ncbi:putative transcriptional regulatory protein YesN [Spirochaetia bacterium]|nr:putative transcriptional regulatory protein YesN [Spirochaetia bacterium]